VGAVVLVGSTLVAGGVGVGSLGGGGSGAVVLLPLAGGAVVEEPLVALPSSTVASSLGGVTGSSVSAGGSVGAAAPPLPLPGASGAKIGASTAGCSPVRAGISRSRRRSAASCLSAAVGGAAGFDATLGAVVVAALR